MAPTSESHFGHDSGETSVGSREDLQTVLDGISAGVILQHASGKILTWNRTAAHIFGLEARDIVGRATADAEWATIREDGSPLPGRDHPSMVTLRTGRPCRGQVMGVRQPNGNYRWISIDTEPIFATEAGAIEAVAISFTDITEQRQVAADLVRSRRSMATLLGNLPGMVYRCQNDPDWTFDYVSEGCLGLTGYEPDNLVNSRTISYAEIIHPEDRQLVWDGVQEALAAGHEFELEYRIITRSGQVRWMWERGIMVPGDLGEPDLLEGFITDITPRKRAEEERVGLELRLRQSQKIEAMGTIAGGIAHDFNNILASIMGYAELALLDAEPESDLQSSLDAVVKASLRARDLVSQILTFSRGGEHDRRPVRLDGIVDEAVGMLRSVLPSTVGIEVVVDGAPPVIDADPSELHQVVVNLATNAVHAIEPNTGTITITVGATEVAAHELTAGELASGRYACLEVRDNGCGIPTSSLGSIFDPYFTTQVNGKGTGLGLAVVHGIVLAHGGGLRVVSTPEVGSVFAVYLPLCATGTAEDPPASGEPVGDVCGHILVVDDEESLVVLRTRELCRQGCEVTAVTDSLQALALFQADPQAFDLVITDMTMPGMAGDELFRAIRSVRADLPVVICTGYSERLGKLADRESTPDAIIHKPVRHEEFLATVRKLLSRPRPGR
ncbi:MAG: PAS domain-containing protein [bacterium]|nr:PAS domain-containing protein [bacterium]